MAKIATIPIGFLIEFNGTTPGNSPMHGHGIYNRKHFLTTNRYRLCYFFSSFLCLRFALSISLFHSHSPSLSTWSNGCDILILNSLNDNERNDKTNDQTRFVVYRNKITISFGIGIFGPKIPPINPTKHEKLFRTNYFSPKFFFF